MTNREQRFFYVLIITLMASGLALLLLRIIGQEYRQQLWLATQESLPIHHAKPPPEATSTIPQNLNLNKINSKVK